MLVLDANYILRYLLNDNEKMAKQAKETILNEHCLILNEVIAEVVYVLSGVYKTPKDVISPTLSDLIMLENFTMYGSKYLMVNALLIYQNKNLDFVDCYLCALSEKHQIKSFDKKLLKCIQG